VIFSDKDIIQLEKLGLTQDKIRVQMALINSGMRYSNLIEAATVGNGILKIKEDQKFYYINLFDSKRECLSIVNFVPASGAATRMFKFLFQFLNDYNINEDSIDAYIEKSNNKELSIFLENLEALPFFEEVIHKIHTIIPDYNKLSFEKRRIEFVKSILEVDQLNYSCSPKGLLPFHKYENYVTTAFEEHLYEGALYGSSNNTANLHFTISENHDENFKNELNRIEEKVGYNTKNTFNVTFSFQKKSTDTIALTSDDQLFRDSEGSILFRPSGHGALLENLNELDYDIIFIKNIDNVVVKEYHDIISNYKKILAGILLEVQEQIFKFLNQLDSNNLNEKDLKSMVQFVTNKLNVVVTPEFEHSSLDSKIFYLRDKLNRPIRVCGMVKNQGEPGGGPFWVKDKNGNISLQIVESAQVDNTNESQVEILKNATHFNPVDLVCGIKNYKGESFDLLKYVDNETSFITKKNHLGADIKTLELPGLWNGSMAYWNTIFVEVPLITFNPVKTVNDLLRDSHQVSK
jgi:hypothetical protein